MCKLYIAMTDKQIEASKKQLPFHFKDMTVEQRREYEELSCRAMINCCLVYGEARYNFYDPNTVNLVDMRKTTLNHWEKTLW